MQQYIPEHSASHFATAAVIFMVVISVLYMIEEWGG